MGAAGRGPFVGRDAEVAAVREALAAGRVVTVTGPGGVGKTRLAREALPDAAMCELASASGLGEVVEIVATALGLSLAGVADEADALARLRSVERTVVLDNAEQALPAVREVCAALCTAEVLVTSRTALGREGEVEVPLAGLSGPDGLAVLRAAEVLEAEDEADALALVEAVDGLPLALHLAAGRLPWMRPRDVLAQLDEPRLLATAEPDERHGALWRVLDGSWELLSDPLREVLAQLVVFEDRFTLADADEVVGVEAYLPDALRDLARRSLLEREGRRCRLLQTVRRYVAWRRPPPPQLLARHGDWAVRGPDVHGMGRADRPAQWAVLEARVADLRAVLTRDPTRAPAAALRLDAWAEEHTPLSLHLEVLEQGLERASSPHDRARLGWARGAVLRRLGRREEAREALRASLPDAEGRAEVGLLTVLAICDLEAGRLAEAEALLDEAGAAAVSSDAPDARSGVDATRAFLLRRQGRLDDARRLLDRALRGCQEAGEVVREAQIRLQRSYVLQALGELRTAEEDLDHAVELARLAEIGRLRSQARFVRVVLWMNRSAFSEAEAELDLVLEEARRSGDHVYELHALGNLGSVLAALGSLDLARARIAEARELALRIGASSQLPALDAGAAGIWLAEGELDRAEALLRSLTDEAQGSDQQRVELLRLVVRVLRGDAAAAEALEDRDPGELEPNEAGILSMARALAPAVRGDLERARERLRADVLGPGGALMRQVVQRVLAQHADAAPVLEVRRDGSGAVLPDGTEVDLRRNPLLGRLLVRLAQPDEPADVDALVEAGWPGQRILPEAASNRVYVAIARLRRAGLGDWVQTTEDGYRLSDAVTVTVS